MYNQPYRLTQLQMILIILIPVLLLLAYLCHIYGVFKPTTLQYSYLLNPHLLYYCFKGDMRSLGGQFEDIKKRASMHFKLSNYFGIYYSQPSENSWKCVLGIMVNPGEKEHVSEFLDQNEKYRERVMSSTRYVGTSFPYVNALTFILFMHSKISKFRELLQEQKIPVYNASFQIYHFNFSPKSIELVNPLHNSHQFQLYQEE